MTKTPRLPTDSLDYEVLEAALDRVPNVDGLLSLEIGTREGGSSQRIMEALARINKDYVHVSVDHYGGMPQAHSDQHTMVLDYTNEMRNRAQSSLFQIAEQTGINYLFMNMDDGEFMRRFADGVPTYKGSRKQIRSSYGFVFFDGPHQTDLVLKEALFFAPRTVEDGIFVFDDVSNFDIDSIYEQLRGYGFYPVGNRTATKAAFIREDID